MKYKLLVLDVDGTLLNEAKEISKRTLAALLKVQQMGVRIVLASGRPTYGLLPLATMVVILFLIMVVRLSVRKTVKSCLSDASIRSLCLTWKRRPGRTISPC